MAQLDSMTQIDNSGSKPHTQSLDLSANGLPERFWKAGAFLRLNENKFWVAVGEWSQVSEAESNVGTMEFFASNPKWWKAQSSGVVSAQELKRFLEASLGPRQLSRSDFSQPDKVGFENSFRTIQGKIQRGEIEKAVPVLKIQSPKIPAVADLAHSMMSAINLPSALQVFGFWNQGEGLLGATPEVLFELSGSKLSSMALAGSCPKSEVGQRQPLLKDPKELREHNLVVEDLATRLKPLGWLRQGPTEILELPTLLHIKTLFEVSGCSKTPAELIRHLHPTAALGVAPRQYGFQWLKDLPEQMSRGNFGAPITFRPEKDVAHSLVAIRSLFWGPQGSAVWAGCGLVAASRFEREFDEVVVKLNSVFRVLGFD